MAIKYDLVLLLRGKKSFNKSKLKNGDEVIIEPRMGENQKSSLDTEIWYNSQFVIEQSSCTIEKTLHRCHFDDHVSNNLES